MNKDNSETIEFMTMGYLAVDSAQLSISDPCYWDDERLNYDKIIEAAEAMDSSEEICYTLGDLPHANASMALVFPTMDGDGVYEVSSVWNGDRLLGYFVSVESEALNGKA
jgi:hypothetical protein